MSRKEMKQFHYDSVKSWIADYHKLTGLNRHMHQTDFARSIQHHIRNSNFFMA